MNIEELRAWEQDGWSVLKAREKDERSVLRRYLRNDRTSVGE